MPALPAIVGYFAALWAAAWTGELICLVRAAGWRAIKLELPGPLFFLAFSLNELAPSLPEGARSTLWLLIAIPGAAWIVLRRPFHLRPGTKALSEGAIWERSRELTALSGTPGRVLITDLRLGGQDSYPHLACLHPDEVDALSRSEVDALMARQLCSGSNWGHEAHMLGITILVGTAALAVRPPMPPAGTELAFLAGSMIAVAALVRYSVPLVWLGQIRRATQFTGNAPAMLSAIQARARLQGHDAVAADLHAIAKAIGIPAAQVPEILNRPLPRPSDERYPCCSITR